MGKSQSKKAKKAKKGPRGKKAREKAKLEKRWGEHVSEEDVKLAKRRKGKSRLLSGPVKGDDPREEELVGGTDMNVEEETEEETDEEMAGGSADAFGVLLSKIAKRRAPKREKLASPADARNADDREAEERVPSGEFSKDDGKKPEEKSEKRKKPRKPEKGLEKDAKDGAIPDAAILVDERYEDHFGKAPLEDEEALSKQSTESLPTPHLTSALEVTISGPLPSRFPATKIDTAREALNAYHGMCEGSGARACRFLSANWPKFNRAEASKNEEASGKESERRYSALQATLYPMLSSYKDVLFTAGSRANRKAVNNLLSLHVLNHLFASTSRVELHDEEIRKVKQREKMEAALTEEKNPKKSKGSNRRPQASEGQVRVLSTVEEEESWRDQGYTKPKVLVLLPTKGACLSFVHNMLDLLGEAAGTVDNLDRFDKDFGVSNEEPEDAQGRLKSVLAAKGAEWNELFGDEVNTDDDFKIGINVSSKLTKKSKRKTGPVSVKLYSEFYQSDLIIASPLGLKMVVEEEDWDFLSSIDICTICLSDVLLMQNWDHVVNILGYVNQQPQSNKATDFSRVRNYMLAGQARRWRQLILVSDLADPHILSTFKKNAAGFQGQVKIRRTVPTHCAAINKVSVSVKQVFEKVPCPDMASQGDAKLNYFVKNVLPEILEMEQNQILIYVPSYFDYVALRNVMMKRELAFVSVTEYSRLSEVSRGRAYYFQGKKKIMLYTGRAHFFRRRTIRGSKHLVFFGLPEHAEFFPQMVNSLREKDGPKGEAFDKGVRLSCLSLFTKYDAHALERIIGSENCKRVLGGGKNTFLFDSST